MQSNNKAGYTALYCRLSSDDGRDGDSGSIANQKLLLEKYANEKNLGPTKVYVDDGYTGTNFNRPGFKQMKDDIEKGFIHTVVVKDLSRFGRDYINVGYYTENYFPSMDIRFIAVYDYIDTNDGLSDYIAYKNINNEFLAKDTSRKVRTAKRLRGNMGEPLSQPPFGYMKDPENAKKWIIDPEAAPIVKKIFDYCIEGKGIETTARLLQEQNILTPMHYFISKGIGRGGKKTQGNPYKWNKNSIRKMLLLAEYTGDLINFKTYSKSYKDKTRRDNPEENWKVFEDHHEAIIDRETFARVQEIRKNTRRRAPKNVEKNMFADILYCADCGSKLWFNINSGNPDISFFNCSNYRGNRGTCNETHYIRADSIEQVVMMELSRLVSCLEYREEELIKLLTNKAKDDMTKENRALETKLASLKGRDAEVSRIYAKLYEDNVVGKLTDERFMELSKRYDNEQAEIRAIIENIETELAEVQKVEVSKDKFIKAIHKFMEMQVLTPAILRELVEKINVYHTQGTGKNRTQRVKIYYRFAGAIDIPKRIFEDNYILEARQGVAVNYEVVA